MAKKIERAVLIEGLDVRDETVQGPHGPIPMRRYAPLRPCEPADSLLWVHGGGFAFGGLDMPESEGVAAAIARAGRVAYGVDYRKVRMWNLFRAPGPGTLRGVHYPVPLDDVVAAFAHVRAESPTGEALLGGASAGGNLSVATALRLRDANEPGPTGLVLAYADAHAVLPRMPDELLAKTTGRGAPNQMSPSMIAKMNWNYAGSLEARDEAYAFPGGHDLHDLPPTLAIDAELDRLRASGGALARELSAAGVPVEYEIVADIGHGFFNKPGTRAYDQGIARITAWLATRRRPAGE